MPEIVFDERIAASYDATSTEMFDSTVVAATVDVLANLARGARALELGIGTGRIAIPLRQHGASYRGSTFLPRWLRACARRRAVPTSA